MNAKTEHGEASEVSAILKKSPVQGPESTTFDLYLSDSIESVDSYLTIAHELEDATEGDEINVYLANHGGSLHGLIFLANILRATEASVTSVILSPCYSAGAMLALCADAICMHQNTFLMFHNYSGTNRGKGAELALSVEETNNWTKQVFHDLVTPFLTSAELKKLMNDKDVYVRSNDKDLGKRVKRHFPAGGIIIPSKEIIV